MGTQDERQRLTETYARFMDAELERAENQSGDLTELAQEVLHAEIERRGLHREQEQAPLQTTPLPVIVTISDPPEPEPNGLVTVRRFRDLPEALLAKGSLESAGIECSLCGDNMVRLDWFWSNMVGGIKLQVAPEEGEGAIAILDQPIPEDLEVPGVGDYHQPRCPECQSLDITYQALDRPAAYLSAFVGVPIPFERRAWRCNSCKAEWKGDDATTESDQTP
jgi:hypothetical protein